MEISEAYERLGVSPTTPLEEIQRAYEGRLEEVRVQKMAMYSMADDDVDEERELTHAFQVVFRQTEDKSPHLGGPTALAARGGRRRRIPLKPSKTLSLRGRLPLPELGPSTSLGGTQLRALREKAGLSVEDVAKLTKINKRYILALEADDQDTLPAPAYVRGFVQAYAAALGLPSGPIVQAYRRHDRSERTPEFEETENAIGAEALQSVHAT